MCEVAFLSFWLCPNTLVLSTLNFLSLEGACHSVPPESLSNLTAVFRTKFPLFLMGPCILISFLNYNPPQIPLTPRAWLYRSQQFFFISSLKAGIHSSLSPATCGLLSTLKVPPGNAFLHHQHSYTKSAGNNAILSWRTQNEFLQVIVGICVSPTKTMPCQTLS